MARQSLAAKTSGDRIVTADGREALILGADKALHLARASRNGYVCPECNAGHACASGCSKTTYVAHVTDAEAEYLRSNGVK